MELQLELFPYYYYSTLGFDEELIDYIENVDDQIVLEKVKPFYKLGGRPPISPITYFRMHYLYFTRPEISSFRQLVKQLLDPKNQAWRNFIGTPHIKDVPCHSSLSHFRNQIGPEVFYHILFHLIAYALKLENFLSTKLVGIDSRPVFAGVNGFKKKRCHCEDRTICECPTTLSDPDATCCVQRNKVNQNKFFIGYRKHSIVCPTPTGPVVLLSIILPNDTADIKVLLPLVEKLKKIPNINTEYLVADLGYFFAEDQHTALVEHDVTVVTTLKKNTLLPEHCSSKGKPECSQGHPLLWDGFDKDTYTSWFTGDPNICYACPLQGMCDKQFGFAFADNPFLYSPIPQGSIVQEHMLRYRKQVELAFAQESNQLDSVLRHKKLPVRRTQRVQSFLIMVDIFQLIKKMLSHIRSTDLPREQFENLKVFQQIQVEQMTLAFAV